MSVITACNRRLDGRLTVYAATWAWNAAATSVLLALLLDRLPGPLRLRQPFNRKAFFLGTPLGSTLMVATLAMMGLEGCLVARGRFNLTDPIGVANIVMTNGVVMAGVVAATRNRPLVAGLGAMILWSVICLTSLELVLSPIYLVWTRKDPPIATKEQW